MRVCVRLCVYTYDYILVCTSLLTKTIFSFLKNRAGVPLVTHPDTAFASRVSTSLLLASRQTGLFTCVRVCMYVYMCICVCVCICVYIYIFIYLYIYIYICVYIYIYTHTYTYIHMLGMRLCRTVYYLLFLLRAMVVVGGGGVDKILGSPMRR